MTIVYDDAPPTAAPAAPAAPVAPSGTIVYDAPPPAVAASEDKGSLGVFQRNAPQERTLSSLVTGDALPKPDKYMQAAIAQRDRLLNAGASLPEGYTRRLMSGPLLGWSDELMAGASTPLEMARHGTWDPREGYAYGKARETLADQATREKTGYLGDAAETLGALATLPSNFMAKGVSAALGGARQGAGWAARAIPNMLGYGAESGVLGAVQGAGQAPTVQEMPAAATRGGVTGAALGAPFGAFANVVPRSAAAVPTEAELTALGRADYRARDRVPVSFDSRYVGNRLDQLRQATQNGYAYDAPASVASLDKWATTAHNRADAAAAANAAGGAAPPGSVVAPGQVSGAPNTWTAIHTPKELASIKRNIAKDVADASPTDQRAGYSAANIFDRILTRPNPAALAPGSTMADAALAASLHSRGRDNFAAGFRSNTITDAISEAADRAAGANSGLNFENTLRQRIGAAKRADEFRGFNAGEQAGADRLIKRSIKADALRSFGNLLGGGGGLGQLAAFGVGGGGGALGSYLYGQDPLIGAGVGLTAGLSGRVMRGASNRMMRNAGERFAEDLRRRSPEYAARVAVAPTIPGPGLGPVMSGARTTATVGAGGDIRDSIARSILVNSGMQSPEDL
jgi:hypothetical protein